jgi:outer membrane lipoprotein SlyB
MSWNPAHRRALRLGLCAVVLFAPVLAACSRAQKPVLYPTAKTRDAGPEQVQRDIDDCRKLASDYVESTAGRDIAKGAAVGGGAGAAVGAAGGAVRGAMSGRGAGAGAATGAAVGAATGATAGVVHGAVKNTEPNPVYKQFVNRCLRERGYDVIGWQ